MTDTSECTCGYATGDTGFHQPWCNRTSLSIPATSRLRAPSVITTEELAALDRMVESALECNMNEADTLNLRSLLCKLKAGRHET